MIEGAGSYGAQLARNVTDTGYRVVEAARMSGGRRGVGKSDPIDAQRIAAAVLAPYVSEQNLVADETGIYTPSAAAARDSVALAALQSGLVH